MIKLYGSMQHSAVHFKCQQSSILNDITDHVTGGFLHKLMMYGCTHQVYICVDIVQRESIASTWAIITKYLNGTQLNAQLNKDHVWRVGIISCSNIKGKRMSD